MMLEVMNFVCYSNIWMGMLNDLDQIPIYLN